MDARDEMMALMQPILDARQPVTLLNTYRGIPIKHEAIVLAIDQGLVAVSVHEYQAVAMALEGKTFIQSPLLPEVFQATAVAVDIPKKRVALAELVGVGDSVGKRTLIRVHPDELIEAEIYDGRRRIGGKIADVSTSGVGVFTFAAYYYGDLSFEKGKDVFVDFMLPTTESIVRFQGIVTHVVDQKGTYMHRLGVRIFPSPEVEPLLEAYIEKRRREIMQELKLIFWSMSQQQTE